MIAFIERRKVRRIGQTAVNQALPAPKCFPVSSHRHLRPSGFRRAAHEPDGAAFPAPSA